MICDFKYQNIETIKKFINNFSQTYLQEKENDKLYEKKKNIFLKIINYYNNSNKLDE
jgi:hypothetical protein